MLVGRESTVSRRRMKLRTDIKYLEYYTCMHVNTSKIQKQGRMYITVNLRVFQLMSQKLLLLLHALHSLRTLVNCTRFAKQLIKFMPKKLASSMVQGEKRNKD